MIPFKAPSPQAKRYLLSLLRSRQVNAQTKDIITSTIDTMSAERCREWIAQIKPLLGAPIGG